MEYEFFDAGLIQANRILRISTGQWEAGRALGLHRTALLLKIILPQAYRSVLPAIGNELVLVMKGSTLASAVTVLEMTGAARVFVARSYAPLKPSSSPALSTWLWAQSLEGSSALSR